MTLDRVEKIIKIAAGMRLTEPIRVSLEDADAIVSDIAAVQHSILTMTPLGDLRYGSVPHHEARGWLESCYKVGLPEELKCPRISGLDNDGCGPNVTRMEFLIIQDLDLEPLKAVSEASSGAAQQSHGRVVAYAEFKYHPPAEAKSEVHVPQSEDAKAEAIAKWKTIQTPKAVHRELHEHWNNVVEEAIRTEFGGMHCFEIRGLATLSPSHLRKGIASELLGWIFPWADRLNVPVVLAATPPGYLLYLRHDFVEIDSENAVLECNLDDWRGTGVHKHVLMVRWPKKDESVV